MSEQKHTPGPWYVGQEDEPTAGVPAIEILYNRVPSPACELVAYAQSADGYVLTDRDRANAHLIAAAPELLEALKQCAAVCAGETVNKAGLVKALEAAKAAIAKAEQQ